MDIKAKLNDAIKEMEDLKKVLTQTEETLRRFKQQKQNILDTGLIVQGRIQTLQEIIADEEKAEAPKEATPLEVK